LSRFFPSGSLNVGAYERLVQVGSLARQLAVPAPARILVVGGGALGEGMEALDGVEGVTLIETDIYLSGRVSVACDGHHLPFADGVFDAVVVQAVLEHVISPQRVVEEIHRVLRPSGIVYAETPFMQQVHEGAFDFTRFTELGHRRLFRMFEEIDRGAALGPATALVWSLRYFMRALPPRSYRTALALDRLALLATFWLKYLDRRLVKHPGGRDAASGVYFLGRRAEQALADRDLVEAYRGLIPSIVEKRGIG
jgi:SAM-dependent methyltransferase